MKIIKRFLWVLTLLITVSFAAVNFVACEGSSGGECDACDASASDCNDGLSCNMFSDGMTRCSTSSTTCDGF
jgi:hypothetical protein